MFLLPVVYISLQRIIKGPTCGVTIVTRTTITRLIAKQLPNSNSRKRLALKPKLDPGKKSLVFLDLFEETNALKRQLKPEKTASSKKRTRKGESILSTEINLTTSSDKIQVRNTCLLLLNHLALAKPS
jgi:hypothetical protein